jgi:uncharacterized membrane protein YbhN (UPF0104 family)
MKKSRWLQALAILLGGLALIWFISQAEWGAVLDAFQTLGWQVVWLLFPFLLVYFFDTLGWYVTLTQSIRKQVSFLSSIWIRWGGEAVNSFLPTAYIGGEAVKVLLIQRRGGDAGQATTAAIISKTTQTIAEVLFIAWTSYLARSYLPVDSPLRSAMWWVSGLAALVGLALFGAQFLGLLSRCVRLARRWVNVGKASVFVRDKVLDRLENLDKRLGEFYRGRRLDTWKSIAAFFAGWMAGSLEILLMATLLEVDISLSQALTLEAFIGVAKGLGIFVPGAIGVQESGIIFLVKALGFPEPFGSIYAVARRAREIIYACFGMLILSWLPRSLFGKAGTMSMTKIESASFKTDEGQ